VSGRAGCRPGMAAHGRAQHHNCAKQPDREPGMGELVPHYPIWSQLLRTDFHHARRLLLLVAESIAQASNIRHFPSLRACECPPLLHPSFSWKRQVTSGRIVNVGCFLGPSHAKHHSHLCFPAPALQSQVHSGVPQHETLGASRKTP